MKTLSDTANLKVSWAAFGDALEIMLKDFKDRDKDFSLGENLVGCEVWGLTRGGLTTAQYLAYKFNLPVQVLGKRTELQPFEVEPRRVILADDVLDTGKTLESFVPMIEDHGHALEAIFVPFNKLGVSEFLGVPVFSGVRVPKEKWIDFPWD